MRIVDFILNILFPPRCTYCNKEGDFLCIDCVSDLKIKDLCRKRRFYNKEREFEYLDGVIYGVDYAENPQIKSAVQQFKYRFTQDLANVFGGLMADKLSELGMNKGKTNVLIPVPLHKKRLNYRGFNQAELLAESASKKANRTNVLNCLSRVRHTDQQAKLSKKERHENLDNAFCVNDLKVDKKSIYFVVDDICTTGATLENCAKTLKSAGIEKVYGLVIARALKT